MDFAAIVFVDERNACRVCEGGRHKLWWGKRGKPGIAPMLLYLGPRVGVGADWSDWSPSEAEAVETELRMVWGETDIESTGV